MGHFYKILDNLNPSDSTDVPADRPKSYNKALFLLKLKEEQRLPQVAVDGLIGDISILLEEILSLKQNVIQHMQEGHVSAELISEVNEQFTERVTTSPFEGLQTSYLQKKHFIDRFTLVVGTT